MDMAVNKLRARIRLLLAANFPWKQATAIVARVGTDSRRQSHCATETSYFGLSSITITQRHGDSAVRNVILIVHSNSDSLQLALHIQ